MQGVLEDLVYHAKFSSLKVVPANEYLSIAIDR